MTRHISFHTGSHFICRHCQESWPCETAMLVLEVERLSDAISHMAKCPQLRRRGCRIVIERTQQS